MDPALIHSWQNPLTPPRIKPFLGIPTEVRLTAALLGPHDGESLFAEHVLRNRGIKGNKPYIDQVRSPGSINSLSKLNNLLD